MYEENQYEHALAIWRVLEADTDSLSPNDRARYAYLRGMTDYRLGFRADSRHWLGIAKATDAAQPGGLSAAWHERLEESLADLNQSAYGAAQDAGSSQAAEYAQGTPGDAAADAGTGTSKGTGTGGASGSGSPLPPSTVQAGRCHSNADCKAGEICDGKSCSPL